MGKKARVKVERIEKRDGYFNVRYRYADLGGRDSQIYRLYGAKQHGAIDELDAFNRFIRCMKEVNYEVVTEEQ
jgi:hypothetical protein